MQTITIVLTDSEHHALLRHMYTIRRRSVPAFVRGAVLAQLNQAPATNEPDATTHKGEHE